MKKINFKNIVSYLSLLFLISSCYYDNEEELYPISNCDTIVTISFSQDIEPLIQTKCAVVNCHLNVQPPFFTSYEVIESNKNNINQRVWISKDMPPPSSPIELSDAERLMIRNWICQGALNN